MAKVIQKTNNAVLVMQQYTINPNSSYGSYSIGEDDKNDPIGVRTGIGLRTILLEDLLGIANADDHTDDYTMYLPTNSISASDDESWDYFDIYDQNSFSADRYIYTQPIKRNLSIKGNFIINSTNNDNTIDSIIIDNSGQGKSKSPIINASLYILNFINIMNNYCNDTKKYKFSIMNQYLGSYFLPENWSISIPAGTEFSDATWSMSFIGPPIDPDPNGSGTGTTGVSTLPAPPTMTPPDVSLGYRVANTRDFYFIPESSNGVSNNIPIIISLDLSVEITWDPQSSFGSYYIHKTSTGTREKDTKVKQAPIPAPYYWSMSDQRGSIAIKEMYIFDKYAPGYIPLTYSVINQIQNQNKFDKLQVYYLNNYIYQIQQIYWNSSSIEYSTDNIIVISRKGKFHNISTNTDPAPYVG